MNLKIKWSERMFSVYLFVKPKVYVLNIYTNLNDFRKYTNIPIRKFRYK